MKLFKLFWEVYSKQPNNYEVSDFSFNNNLLRLYPDTTDKVSKLLKSFWGLFVNTRIGRFVFKQSIRY